MAPILSGWVEQADDSTGWWIQRSDAEAGGWERLRPDLGIGLATPRPASSSANVLASAAQITAGAGWTAIALILNAEQVPTRRLAGVHR